MTDNVHLVATNEREYGWSLRSPQVPGLAYGRDTEERLLAELDDVLAFAEAPDGPRQLHQETRHVSPEGIEYVVRVAADRHTERADVAQRLHVALTDAVGNPDIAAALHAWKLVSPYLPVHTGVGPKSTFSNTTNS